MVFAPFFLAFIIWGTMTLVIFYTNALSPYCPGGGTKKKMPARAATIFKNFFTILKKNFSILITEDDAVSHLVTTCNAQRNTNQSGNVRTTPTIEPWRCRRSKLYAGKRG